MHGGRNYPFHKVAGTLDVELADGTGDDVVSRRARATRSRACSRASAPDLVVYIAGADPHEGDRLGRLALTFDGLARRDAMVLDRCREVGIPVAITIGGGYGRASRIRSPRTAHRARRARSRARAERRITQAPRHRLGGTFASAVTTRPIAPVVVLGRHASPAATGQPSFARASCPPDGFPPGPALSPSHPHVPHRLALAVRRLAVAGAPARARRAPRPAADAPTTRHDHRSSIDAHDPGPHRRRVQRRSATSRSTDGSTTRRGRRRRRSPTSARSTRTRASRRRSAPRCASSTTTRRCTSARGCTSTTGPKASSPGSSRRDATCESRLLRGRDRRVPRPPRPRLLRRQSFRREVRRARRRHVVLRPVVGPGLGGGDARSTRSAGPPSCASRTRSSASRATACRRGGCRCGATSSARNEHATVVVLAEDRDRRPVALRASRGAPHRQRAAALELLPYVVTRSRHIAPTRRATRSTTAADRTCASGGDVKALLTSNLTLDATINPDFGQVEVDPAVVNLSAFETFFEEKRPFFVAGSSVFNFGNVELLLLQQLRARSSRSTRGASAARRRAPSLAYDAATFADVPEDSTILGAAKITGRTSKRVHASAC